MYRIRGREAGIETLIAVPAMEAFAARQAAVMDTVRTRGLNRGNAVLVGTAGLAAYGIDAHIERSSSGFDIDAFVDDPTFGELQNIDGAISVPSRSPTELHLPATDSTLPISGLRTPLTNDLAQNYRARTFNDLHLRTTTVDGVLVLSPAELARTKIQRSCSGIKDPAGIIQGHVVAWMTSHPIVNDLAWQSRVVGARNRIDLRISRSRTLRRELPSWLGHLTASGFDHPAFTSLSPDPILARAS